MIATINNRNISGIISAISSKSFAHRALICASLSNKPTKIICTDLSKDIVATVNCLKAIGVKIERKGDSFLVNPLELIPKEARIDCGESGSTLRFLLPVLGALGIDTKITMHGRLKERPLYPLDEQMFKYGCSLRKEDNILYLSGKLSGGEYEIAGNISSQFISGLMFALPIINEKSTIKITNSFESKSYVELTENVLNEFCINYMFENDCFSLENNKYISPSTINVEGDWSNSAFWLCAGALSEKGIKVENLNISSVQGDKQIVEVLKEFGANVKSDSDGIFVSKNKLKGIKLDAKNIPDLVPIIAILASLSEGKTRIFNASRLRIKESDRLASVAEMINNIGGKCVQTDDGLIIDGKIKLNGGRVNSYNDHRIAMSAAIASVCCENEVIIDGAEAVEKSYPKFYNDFKKLGGVVNEQ